MSGSLPFNCAACRAARTKCDRTAPRCRRCQRLGLTCVVVPTKRGRPRKKHAAGATRGAKRPRAAAGTNDAADQQEPARVLLTAVLQIVQERSDATIRSWLRLQVRMQVRRWTWLALVRQSSFLLSEATMLTNSCKLPFTDVDSIMRTHYSAQLLRSRHAVSPKSLDSRELCHYWQNVDGAAFYERVPQHATWEQKPFPLLLRCSYYGRAQHFASPQMRGFMCAGEADDLWREGRTDIFGEIIGKATLPRLLKVLVQTRMRSADKPFSYTFDTQVGPVPAIKARGVVGDVSGSGTSPSPGRLVG